MSNRPLRLCDSCLQVDDHPRHVYATSGAEGDRVLYTDEQRRVAVANCAGESEKLVALLRDFDDNATQMKHLDCCLADGCPTGDCKRQLEDSAHPFDGGKTKGQALIDQLEAHVASLSEKGK